MDDVFRALADPSRRRLLDRLNERNGQTLRELSAGLDMARQSVSKHLGILEAANLITTIRHGRDKLHYLNAEPINAISERWIRNYDRARIAAVADLKSAVESTMNDNDFVYTTYIAASPELVWRGLTDPAFTRRYWGIELETDWTPGSTFAMNHVRRGVTVADDEMVVKTYEPYTRLAYTWMVYTQELSDAIGFEEGHVEKAAREPRSTVTFDLVEQRGQTRLTVVQSGFPADSVVLPDISGGWPLVLAWLKTFLESGEWQKAEEAAASPA
jgi:uncharacterized protein YndB with AHSA1/START domain/DNA-binding transcriptional ArsR family regulator